MVTLNLFGITFNVDLQRLSDFDRDRRWVDRFDYKFTATPGRIDTGSNNSQRLGRTGRSLRVILPAPPYSSDPTYVVEGTIIRTHRVGIVSVDQVFAFTRANNNQFFAVQLTYLTDSSPVQRHTVWFVGNRLLGQVTFPTGILFGFTEQQATAWLQGRPAEFIANNRVATLGSGSVFLEEAEPKVSLGLNFPYTVMGNNLHLELDLPPNREQLASTNIHVAADNNGAPAEAHTSFDVTRNLGETATLVNAFGDHTCVFVRRHNRFNNGATVDTKWFKVCKGETLPSLPSNENQPAVDNIEPDAQSFGVYDKVSSGLLDIDSGRCS